MPLMRFTGEQAIENRKSNRYGAWGDRASPNRVEPVAKPGFAVPVKLRPGSKIFTVGSCFARNVEEELERRGFDLPMRRVILKDAPTDVLNNYAAPSIYNEFAWAFGEKPFTVEHHVVEVHPGKFADLHLSPQLRPEPLERVLARRGAITAAYQQAAECPVLIMTLGLVEVWYDKKSGSYMNVSPRPTHLRHEPNRFELHVLSFDETYDYLERVIQLLRKHGLPELQILITVSPVPLTATHRQDDVIVANCYSKSVLRAAAETLVAKHDFVTYYPSYESVTLSDRRLAWRNDFIHVSQEIVAFNVGRMVDAFLQSDESAETMARQIEAGGEVVAVAKARQVQDGSRDQAATFFDNFYPRFSASADFVVEYAQFLVNGEQWERALQVLDAGPEGMPELRMAIMRARALTGIHRAQEAYTVLDSYSRRSDGGRKLRLPAFWHALLEAAMAAGDESAVLSTLARLSAANPIHAARGNMSVGFWYQGRGQIDRAIAFFQTAAAAGDTGNKAYLPLAESLIAVGRRDDARDALQKLKLVGADMVRRAERAAALLEGEGAILRQRPEKLKTADATTNAAPGRAP